MMKVWGFADRRTRKARQRRQIDQAPRGPRRIKHSWASTCDLNVNLSKLSSTQVLFPEQPPRGTIVYRYLEVLAPVALSTGDGRTPLIETPLISIVDDDGWIRGAIEALVRSFGLATRTFASAEAFLESSVVAETRCLVLDVQLPNMSGLELQRHLSHLGFDIPIIFITAYRDETVKARALNGGAICLLHKPVDLQGRRLVDCLHAALDRGKGPAPVT